jgi:EpsG family
MLIYIVYFIFFMVLAVEYELKPFKNILPLVICIALLTFMAGFRGPEVSKDYEGYQYAFDTIHDMAGQLDIFVPILEPGFTAIVMAFRTLFVSNYGLAIMLFFALTSVTLKTISFRELSFNPYLVLLFYYSHFFFLHEMTQIRIGFASAIFFIALIYYLRDNKKLFILLILCATFFHYSALIYLVVLFVDPRTLNRYVYGILLALSIILGYIKLPLLNFMGNVDPSDVSQRLSNYTYLVESGNAQSVNVFNVLNLLNIACCLFFLFVAPAQRLREDKPLTLFLKCNIFSIFLLSLLSGVPSLAFRFSELFGIVSMFVFASLVRYLPFNKLNILITVITAMIIFYAIAFHLDLLNPYYIINIR